MSDQLRENLDYECLRSFSSGAFGKVHHGYLYSTGEAVVIKKGKKKDLKGEYELLKQLSSTGVGRTHVVRVFGYTDNSPHLNHGDFNIIMERAQCSLDILLQRASFRAGLPAVDIIQLVADLGIVLAFLLEKQVAHRDIKPQNILVFSGANDPAKSQFMFKLCDFGAARETIGEESECHTIVGTVPFLNPEILLELREHPQQYRTNQPYRAEKCDLWSLGVTIYNAATARLPWPGTGAHPDDVRALHENRRGAIAALPLAHGPGYKYYDTIRADSYPRWLRHALSSLIRSQFTNASYATFLAQAAYIAGVGGAKEMPAGRRGTQKRLVLLPSLTPSMHAEVDERVFPGASIQLHGLYGLPLTTRTAILTADGITVYGPGQPIALDSFADTTALVWNDQSTGFGPEKGTVYPPPPTPCSREELLQRDVLLCFNLDRQCEEVVDAHRLAASITKRNADRVIARTHELRQWLHSIERNEKHAASTAAVAALMQSRNQDMLDRLQSCPGETAMRRKEVERCAAEAARLAQCAAAWTGMDERHIANWQDSLRRLSSPSKSSDTRSALEMDQKWAATMLKRVQDRLADLKTDANYRVKKEEGIGHVIRGIIALETTLHECVRKMRETAGVVSAVADQARDSISSYMQNTAGLDEAQIRNDLPYTMEAVRRLLPELTTALRKGNCGRLGVVGGSVEYTGAPFYAAISMLKVGADLAHVFTPDDAAPVVKGYAPELIVHPELDPGHWQQRMDAMLVGPGLGREEKSLQVAHDVIVEAQRRAQPLVVDADGLVILTERWESLSAAPVHKAELPIILTPNAVEMDRLAMQVLQVSTLGKPWEEVRLAVSKLAARLKMNIFLKGPTDMFATADGKVRLYDAEGSARRPGGIGDILSGVIAVFLLWSTRSDVPLHTVAEAASFFVREAARRAHEQIGRGMTASDVVAQVAPLMKTIDKPYEGVYDANKL